MTLQRWARLFSSSLLDGVLTFGEKAKGRRCHPNGNAMEEEETIAMQPLFREREIELFYYGSFSLYLLIGRYVGYYLLCNLFSRAASHRQVKTFHFLSPKASASQTRKEISC